ncbi:MAG: hypothetical protein C4527_16505 [Candidatus Omnitrophota bacterium]|nr:MAG: hypothetical protein C4527_16505 [Candidatus Omnitrophota bacterium]
MLMRVNPKSNLIIIYTSFQFRIGVEDHGLEKWKDVWFYDVVRAMGVGNALCESASSMGSLSGYGWRSSI